MASQSLVLVIAITVFVGALGTTAMSLPDAGVNLTSTSGPGKGLTGPLPLCNVSNVCTRGDPVHGLRTIDAPYWTAKCSRLSNADHARRNATFDELYPQRSAWRNKTGSFQISGTSHAYGARSFCSVQHPNATAYNKLPLVIVFAGRAGNTSSVWDLSKFPDFSLQVGISERPDVNDSVAKIGGYHLLVLQPRNLHFPHSTNATMDSNGNDTKRDGPNWDIFFRNASANPDVRFFENVLDAVFATGADEIDSQRVYVVGMGGTGSGFARWLKVLFGRVDSRVPMRTQPGAFPRRAGAVANVSIAAVAVFSGDDPFGPIAGYGGLNLSRNSTEVNDLPTRSAGAADLLRIVATCDAQNDCKEAARKIKNETRNWEIEAGGKKHNIAFVDSGDYFRLLKNDSSVCLDVNGNLTHVNPHRFVCNKSVANELRYVYPAAIDRYVLDFFRGSAPHPACKCGPHKAESVQAVALYGSVSYYDGTNDTENVGGRNWVCAKDGDVVDCQCQCPGGDDDDATIVY